MRGFDQRCRNNDDISSMFPNPEMVVLCPSYTIPLRNAIMYHEISIPRRGSLAALAPGRKPCGHNDSTPKGILWGLYRHEQIERKKLLKH